jgi:hypothetical protein
LKTVSLCCQAFQHKLTEDTSYRNCVITLLKHANTCGCVKAQLNSVLVVLARFFCVRYEQVYIRILHFFYKSCIKHNSTRKYQKKNSNQSFMWFTFLTENTTGTSIVSLTNKGTTTTSVNTKPKCHMEY